MKALLFRRSIARFCGDKENQSLSGVFLIGIDPYRKLKQKNDHGFWWVLFLLITLGLACADSPNATGLNRSVTVANYNSNSTPNISPQKKASPVARRNSPSLHIPKTATPVPEKSYRSGASARCRDGSYSYSRNRRGTCSHHGGVAEWF